jgi:hypothetical protein
LTYIPAGFPDKKKKKTCEIRNYFAVTADLTITIALITVPTILTPRGSLKVLLSGESMLVMQHTNL